MGRFRWRSGSAVVSSIACHAGVPVWSPLVDANHNVLFFTLLCFIKGLTAGRLVYLKPWPAAHHIATALYSHKKSISRENTVLPIEKFPSLVLSRNTICYNTLLSIFLSIYRSIDHFTVVCSVTWPLNGSEAGVDLVLVQTSLLLSCKSTQLAL